MEEINVDYKRTMSKLIFDKNLRDVTIPLEVFQSSESTYSLFSRSRFRVLTGFLKKQTLIFSLCF